MCSQSWSVKTALSPSQRSLINLILSKLEFAVFGIIIGILYCTANSKPFCILDCNPLLLCFHSRFISFDDILCCSRSYFKINTGTHDPAARLVILGPPGSKPLCWFKRFKKDSVQPMYV